MSRLEEVLREAGGIAARREHFARLRELVVESLVHGARELERPRSGYGDPVVVAFAVAPGALAVACPAEVDLRADAAAATERGWAVVAAAVGAAVAALELAPPSESRDLALTAGSFEGWLGLLLPAARGGDLDEAAELAALDFDEEVTGVDRLRARAVAVPAEVLEPIVDSRPPIGATHPLVIAEAVARLGGRPAREASVDAHEEAVLALLQPPGAVARAHDDPDPVRRIARRILQRLDGMGKWGGYHTDFTHLSRGFAPGNERALASEVAERLLAAGLLVEKTSVGQRHVYLEPRRSGDIKRLIDDGTVPEGLSLPTS